MIYDQLNIPQVSKYVTNLICESDMIIIILWQQYD